MSGRSHDQPSGRREYLDWLRGVAVLLMIDAHLFDSWTAVPDRDSRLFRLLMAAGGTGTTLFLFLAGVSVALSAGSKFRRSGDANAAARAVARRGAEVFGLAFLFRLQAWILGWSHRWMDLLKVDILNIMGPSIAAAAWLWRLGTSTLTRALIFAAATVATALVTPAVRTWPADLLPAPLMAYILPVPTLSNFVFFPWMAFVFAGACVGVFIDSGRTPALDRQVHQRLAIGGLLVGVGAYAASFLPSPFAGSYFWTTSPAYLFLRSGLTTAAVAAAYGWLASWGPVRWSPVVQLGRTSLFIYWIHVELVYGLISRPWHKGLTLPQAAVGYVGICVLMLGGSIAKERVAARWSRRATVANPELAALRAGPAPIRSPRSGE